MSLMYQTEITFSHRKLNANLGNFNFISEGGREAYSFTDQKNS